MTIRPVSAALPPVNVAISACASLGVAAAGRDQASATAPVLRARTSMSRRVSDLNGFPPRRQGDDIEPDHQIQTDASLRHGWSAEIRHARY